MSKHLVLVGGGHAHMTVMLNIAEYLKKGHRVTLVSASPYHYYSGMGPGLLGGTYKPQEVRFHIKKMVEERGASFIEGEIGRIDAAKHLLYLTNGEAVGYDVASFNTGSKVSLGGIAPPGETVIPVKPIINLHKASFSITKECAAKKLDIIVIGGGPAGVEIAANVWRLLRNSSNGANIFIVGGSRLLSRFPEKARRLALKSLIDRGIHVLEGVKVQSIENKEAVLSDGGKLPFDYAFIAVGVRPSELFKASDIPTGPGDGLLVNAYLQSVVYPELFGGGDCIELQGHSLAKVGVHAVRQNPLLKRNLMAALEGGRMEVFVPKEDYMLILNMGNNKGILKKNDWVWNGWLSFLLKDYIDRRFMKKFQVSGELEEPVMSDLSF